VTKRRALLVIAGAAGVLLLAILERTKESTPASASVVQPDVERPQREDTTLALAEESARAAEDVAQQPADPTPATPPPAQSGSIRLVGEVRDRQHQRILSSYRQPTTYVSLDAEPLGLSRGIPDGTFEFKDLVPGRIQMTCSARDFRSEQRTVTLVAGEAVHREDFELDPVWNLELRIVLSDGHVLAPMEDRKVLKNDLDLRVSKDPPPERWSCAWTESWHARRIVDRSMGDATQGTYAKLQIQLAPPIHLSANLAGYVVASTRLETQVDQVTLEIPVERVLGLGSSFACRVVDRETGARIPGARARMLPVNSGVDLSLTADAAGEIRGDVPASEYILCVRDGTRSIPWQTVELLPGKLTDLGTIALDPNITLDVRFVDPMGAPVEVDASISPMSHGQIERTVVGGQSHVRSGPDGRCHFENLARSEYVLRRLRSVAVQGDDGRLDARPRVVDLRRGGIPELVVPFESMQRVALSPRSDAARSSAYWIQASDGALCTFGLFDDGQRHHALLAPGGYRLLVGSDLEHAREIPFTVENAPMTIPIEP
jgi:hypothetical protein